VDRDTKNTKNLRTLGESFHASVWTNGRASPPEHCSVSAQWAAIVLGRKRSGKVRPQPPAGVPRIRRRRSKVFLPGVSIDSRSPTFGQLASIKPAASRRSVAPPIARSMQMFDQFDSGFSGSRPGSVDRGSAAPSLFEPRWFRERRVSLHQGGSYTRSASPQSHRDFLPPPEFTWACSTQWHSTSWSSWAAPEDVRPNLRGRWTAPRSETKRRGRVIRNECPTGHCPRRSMNLIAPKVVDARAEARNANPGTRAPVFQNFCAKGNQRSRSETNALQN